MKLLKLAFLPQQRLGDGVITLVLANNLFKNNFNITMYHDYMQQINDWFDYEIESCPEQNDMEDTLKEFDIVLMDRNVPYVLSKTKEEQVALSRKYIFFSVGKMDSDFIYDHTEQLVQKIGNEHRVLFESIAKACQKIKYNKHDSMVDNMVKYCQQTLHLKHVNNQTGIHLPPQDQYRKHTNRVVISPTSSLEKKNCGVEKFIAIARQLKIKGYEPVFAVAMNEREEWEPIVNNKFSLREFASIKIYAEYLYESVGFIGNDSGGGHVASMMRVPVLTLVSSSKKLKFRWRPGWGNNVVVAPKFSIKFRGKRYWHSFLSVKKVIQEFEKLIS